MVGVGGEEEVGAGAGFDLEAEDLGAGEVADDPDFRVRLLEIASAASVMASRREAAAKT